jgi:uncharacterized protein YbjT (DUF2867 family)
VVVLLTGASGFIGRSVAAALEQAGHEVLRAARDVDEVRRSDPRGRYVAVDYTRDRAAADWTPRLAGVDVVINAVGIFRERGTQTFEAIHVRGPRALFSACAAVGIKVIQVSALGADAGAASAYHLSKREADEFLLRVCPAAAVAQPSVVFGKGGASARLFATLAALPVVPLPGREDQVMQPIHVDDLAAAIVGLVETDTCAGRRVPLVGREPTTLGDFLAALRHAMGLGSPAFVRVPWPMAIAAARLAALHPRSLLDVAALDMLARGSTADASATTRLLGSPPRSIAEFIPAADARAVLVSARLGWLLPMLRLMIAAVWIASGVVSLGLFPVEESYALLARAGLTGQLAALALYGAAALDLAFGIATLALARRRALWIAQAAVIVLYTLIITVTMPEYWLHPFGPVLKNLPMLAAIWLLYELEEER